ncbi:MAG: hypothetical protein M3548_21480, partial [Actinomycetota bacterium]|nr:hypothetical protein [Actinomycetota bacterium]
GNGTAAATVTVTLTRSGDMTHGEATTDLAITGRPAQFGRGLISEVGGKILTTFATCLAGKLTPVESTTRPAAFEPTVTDPESLGSAADAQAGTGDPAVTEGRPRPQPKPARDQEPPSTSSPGKPDPGESTVQRAPGASPTVTTESAAPTRPLPLSNVSRPPVPPTPSAATTESAASPQPGPPSSVPRPTDPPTPSAPNTPESTPPHTTSPPRPHTSHPDETETKAETETEAIDLLSFAGPSIAKRLVIGAVVLAVAVFVIRRRR